MISADNTIAYFHNDHLGTPQKMTNGSGAIVWAADYLPFGEADVTVETVENNLRMPGQIFDKETGLHYNFWRFYDPGLGRYLRADPIGLEGGINLYSYVQNNPVNVIDPDGLIVISLTKKALKKVHNLVGGSLKKGKPGKFGSPQRGTPQKGYRLDPPHPDAKPGSPESYPHINWWDFTKGKKGKGGRYGAEAIKGITIIGGLLELLDYIDPIALLFGELADDDMIPLEQQHSNPECK